jgi:diguanylate cyclase (GGDEF)-like protein
MQWKLRFASLAVFVSMLSPQVWAAEGFEERLQAADQARSSDPKMFMGLLEKLQSEQKKATPLQRQRLRYLLAYRTAAYQDKLKEATEQAKKLFAETKDAELKYRAGSLVANLSAIQRDFGTGLRYIEKTLPLRAQVKDKGIRHDGIGAAAMLYNEIGQYAIGKKYADEMLADAPSARILCAGGHVQVESRFRLGDLKDDVRGFQSYVDQCSKIREYIPANLIRATLARKLAAEGRTDLAIVMLDEALPEVQATKYPRLIAEVRSILSELKLSQGDYVAAKSHADATIALGDSIASTQALVTAYYVLYQLAAQQAKPDEALALYKMYAEADKARQSDVKARELAYEIVRHETQQKTKEIELLQAQQRLERENTQKAQLTTLFLAILLAGAVFWAFQVKRHQHQLKKLAQTDSLTGLGNRHFFTQKSERALVEAARAGEPASLVMFDLDHFKAINDTYGHGAGDWVLKQVGKTCASHCRKIDYLGRIGGEEFAVLLSGIDLAAAERLAETCRAQLAQIDTRDCGYSFVVTASFGVSSTAQSGYDLSRLLSHADQMLYRAKNEGRNRVCAYTAEAAADHRSVRRAPSLSVVNS